ncbi:Sphingosine-1-phosphate lyase 1 [Blomia tropicalis]|nr:Sphingosine-1-phosphate lyase 1 [Blomia tropicalis]
MDYYYDCAKLALKEAELYLEKYTRVHIVIASVIGTWLLLKVDEFYQDGDFSWATMKARLFRAFIKLPIIRSIAAKELKTFDDAIVKHCRSIYKEEKFMLELQRKGLNEGDILKKLKTYQDLSNVQWRNGRVSGAVYSNLTQEISSIVQNVYNETAYTNPLHPDCFPGINKMEAEIIRMVINLFSGNDDCCGAVTSGGTESIVLAIKAYRDYAYHTKGITKPELVAPATAHAAFPKACQYFCIKFVPTPVDPVTYKADINAMRKAINRNTILIVGSACNFPHGLIDDIQAIAKLGLKYNVPVHVDSCLGGFLVPFVKEAGFSIPPVDFSVDGVTSISCDTHKYGYAPKGSSVIMYSDKEYRRHQFSVITDWPGGIYASPTIAGSRAGASIATCWATLLHYGVDGYVDATRKILKVQRYLKAEISKIDGIFIVGDPLLSVIAIGSKMFNVFRLSDMLSKKGWNLNPLQFPSAFHICLTLMHVQDGVADAFLDDLKQSVVECLKNPDTSGKGMAVMYGMSQSIPDRTMVSDLACQYLSTIYDTN